MAEYEHNERNCSTPMFPEQPRCLGVFSCVLERIFCSDIWKDWDAANRLKTSKSYLEASNFHSDSGMLVGEPSLQAFEVCGAFLNPQLSENLES